MKKVSVLVVVALVAVASAFAFEFKSVGLETGTGIYVSSEMGIIDNLDVYGRLGFNGLFSISVGGQYKVHEFEVQGTDIDIKPGAQMNFGFGKNTFFFSLLATCQFSFETGHFGVFARPGLGFDILSYRIGAGGGSTETVPGFALAIETGILYQF